MGRLIPGGPPEPDLPSVTLPVSGVWLWELRTVDAEGDLRLEREEWHLNEVDGGISGYYERNVERSRPGGTFSCNGSSKISTATQYIIRGQRFGDRLTLSEVDFRAQPDPCDNGQRRLDTYRGILSPNGQEILLSWGSGSQILKKRK
jgi:hypothetical protein